MANDVVVAFLSHLAQDKAARKRIEHKLLEEVVAFADREGYDFSGENFRGTLEVVLTDGVPDLLKWPATR